MVSDVSATRIAEAEVLIEREFEAPRDRCRDRHYNGFLDEVQNFHRELTADEVGQLFTLGTCPQGFGG